MNEWLIVSEEVRRAVDRQVPVVALESTIIAHGMPSPANLEIAERLEAAVRAEGAVPAMIAVAEGAIRVGVDRPLLERLARGTGVAKVSRADLPAVLEGGELGATTVAATMICSHLAGIAVFATGGIGGVHREVGRTMDISADLEELAATPVAVVCAGAKAILDLPRTLEYLETRGVPVVGFGTDELPAFWTRSSGLALQLRRDTPEGVARLIRVQRGLGYRGGMVVAAPIPEAAALPASMIAAAIDAALREADRRGVQGKQVTPFLLAHVNEATAGRTLEANVALALNNATIAARIARALASDGVR